MASLGQLTMDVIARIGGFTGPLTDAERQTRRFQRAVDDAGKAIANGLAVGITAMAAGVGIAVGAMAAMVATQLEVIDSQAKMAGRLRTTSDSMGILTRAGELAGVSLSQLENGAQKLELAFGKAAAGGKAQIEAFDQLGINWRELSELPLDQRILKVNDALKANVSAAERAAVGAALFGAKNVAAFAGIDNATLEEANRQITVFGVKLSEIDSSKVEAANDAVSLFALAFDGLSKQLTVVVSPLLTKLSNDFLTSSEAAGGLGTAVQDAAQVVVNGVAAIADAGDAAYRVFDTVAQLLVGTYAGVAADLQTLSADIADVLAKLPGFAGGEEFAKQSAEYRAAAIENAAVVKYAAGKIRQNLETPLAGEGLKKYFAEANEEAQAAAEAAAAAAVIQAAADKELAAASTARARANDAASTAGLAAKSAASEAAKASTAAAQAAQAQADALNRAFSSSAAGYERQLELAADANQQQTLAYQIQKGNLVGINAEQQDRLEGLAREVDLRDQIATSEKEYADLVKNLRTEDEARNDLLLERLDIIQAIAGVPADEKASQTARAIGESTEDAPKYAGLAPEVGGPFGEFAKLDEAEQELADWYLKQTEMLAANRQERADLNAEWDAEELSLKKQHEDALAAIEAARRQAGLAAMSQFFGQLSELRNSDSKKGRALGKAAAIAQATINAYTAATGAYASASAIPVVGWVLGPVAAATALAAGLANVAAIKGQAHDGIDSVPETGTWLLQKGERVTTAETSAKLDATLDRLGGGKSSSGGSVTQNIYVQGQVDRRTQTQLANDAARNQRQAAGRLGG